MRVYKTIDAHRFEQCPLHLPRHRVNEFHGAEKRLQPVRIVAGDVAMGPLLVDGEVAVLMSAGHEKARYVSGYATAIRNDFKHVSIVLSDIYELAAEKLGKLPTDAPS